MPDGLQICARRQRPLQLRRHGPRVPTAAAKPDADGHTYLVFLALTLGLAFIGWRIARGVKARRRRARTGALTSGILSSLGGDVSTRRIPKRARPRSLGAM